jgi:lysophospholipase L1-like esterase
MNSICCKPLRISSNTATPDLSSAWRQALNAFIETSSVFDAVVDFDAVTLDPATGEMKAEFIPESTTGDRLHPNRAGYLAMGAAIDLGAFGVAP